MPAAARADAAVTGPLRCKPQRATRRRAQALRAMLATTGALQRRPMPGPLPQRGRVGHILLGGRAGVRPRPVRGRSRRGGPVRAGLGAARSRLVCPGPRHHLTLRGRRSGPRVPIHFPGHPSSAWMCAALTRNTRWRLGSSLGVALACLLAMMAALYAFGATPCGANAPRPSCRLSACCARRWSSAVAAGSRAPGHPRRPLDVNQAFCRLVGWPAEALVDTTQPMPDWPGASGAMSSTP